ncbi:MAG: hypothetical protein ABMB14_20050, partial [Myxococcota bacterium]
MEPRYRRIALAALVVLAAAMQLPSWGWEVEDAGIDLAYARSLASGLGLVAQAGAERVEGFSNPSWVGLLAVGDWLGFEPFALTRWLGLALGCAAVPAVYAAMRSLDEDWPVASLGAATAIALYAPHAIWAQSGLENALFTVLLAVACARVVNASDVDVGGPLAFLALAWTRPEGVMYAVIGAGAAIASARTWSSAARRSTVWVAAFVVPFLGAELVRVLYFGQELPATFYAKLGTPTFRPADPASRGWTQLVAFLRQTGTAAVVPLAVVGAFGAGGWRWVAGVVALVLVGISLVTASPWPVAVVIAAIPVLSIGRRLPIGIAAALVLVGCAFQVGTDGDWMRGYRWMSLVAVPGAMLVGAGLGELVRRLDDL